VTIAALAALESRGRRFRVLTGLEVYCQQPLTSRRPAPYSTVNAHVDLGDSPVPPTRLPSSADALIVGPGPTDSSAGASENGRPWVALLTLIALHRHGGDGHLRRDGRDARNSRSRRCAGCTRRVARDFVSPPRRVRSHDRALHRRVALMVEHAEHWRGRTPELVMVLAPGWAASSFVFDERIAQSIPLRRDSLGWSRVFADTTAGRRPVCLRECMTFSP
jgi:hypothetical protein